LRTADAKSAIQPRRKDVNSSPLKKKEHSKGKGEPAIEPVRLFDLRMMR
jgi:hypothetical protein